MAGLMSINVSLTDDLGDFVQDRIASGRYASANDVVRDALRLLEQHEENARKLEWLREAYREGLESGIAGEIDFDEIRAEGRAILSKAAK